jgi:hypothetical protein
MLPKYIKTILLSIKLGPRKCFFILCFILCSAFLISCKKFIDVGPPKTQIVTPTVYSNDATVISAVRGIYSEMYNDGFASGNLNGLSQLSGFSADEFSLYSSNSDQIQFYSNSISSTNGTLKTAFWESAYKFIYYSNAILEGLSRSTGVTLTVQKQAEGEAKFIRAFCYFYLTNLFGDVPLVLTTDYRKNSTISRKPKSDVFQQIVLDLLDAQSKLASDYSNEGDLRIRANKWAATALLARVYLYNKEWSNAEAQATLVIENSSLFSLESDLNNVFLSTSPEAIWQLMPVVPEQNTNEAQTFILIGVPTTMSLSNELLNSFELNDKRKATWVDSVSASGNTYYYPFKYKVKGGAPATEFSMVLRLAELYLVRAEARAQLNNISSAQNDLNIVRNRAGLENTTANNKTSLLQAIEHERQIELFSEWGHRWLDLIRTDRANSVLGSIKAPNWETTDQLYPVPQSERINNSNLTQNPGY